MTTFDSKHELQKIAGSGLDSAAILRIAVPPHPDGHTTARVDLGLKFGADAWIEAPALVAEAAKLGVAVVGVSFHVGSSCHDPDAFDRAICAAAHAASLMYPRPTLLDVGGGFGRQMRLSTVAPIIRASIARHFPCGIRVVAEPGRYFAEDTATIFAPVHGKRVRPGGHRDYFITDGLYGSFNCVLYDRQDPPVPSIVDSVGRWMGGGHMTRTSTVWGPTCDSADRVLQDVQLPELQVGDWMAFPGMGAYTIAGACDFNGMPLSSPRKFYLEPPQTTAVALH